MRSPIRLVPRTEAEEASLFSVMRGDIRPEAQHQSDTARTYQGRVSSRQARMAASEASRARLMAHRTQHRAAAKTTKAKQASSSTKQKKSSKAVTPPQAEMKWRGLPSELIDHILSYCWPEDLLSLCTVSKALYLHSLPHLYRNFNKVAWTDIIVLKRRLQSGFGPTSTNPKETASLIGRSIRNISIEGHDHLSSLRSHAFTNEETAESLADVAALAGNLR